MEQERGASGTGVGLCRHSGAQKFWRWQALQCGLNAGLSVVYGSRRWNVKDRAGASED